MQPEIEPLSQATPPRITAEHVKQHAIALGFHKVGIASATPDSDSHPLSVQNRDRLQAWLDQGYHADMQWMTHPKRQDLHAIMPNVRSVICVALNYYVPDQRSEELGHGKIARYAWGRDYHKVLTRRLKQLAHWLEQQDKAIEARFYVDTGPVQDKVWAEQAGLGWVAKNSNLITRDYGSWVFLGEVLTNLALMPDHPHPPHCGTCQRCIDACPTGAIAQPFVVDANRCIAYHTIENRAEQLPDAIAQHLEGWVAGCDICQDVCPWNSRFAQATDVEDFQARSDCLAPELTRLANVSEDDYRTQFLGSALRRIKPHMWRRNAQACLDH
jgi:epoxyqueuosine reductase